MWQPGNLSREAGKTQSRGVIQPFFNAYNCIILVGTFFRKSFVILILIVVFGELKATELYLAVTSPSN